MQDIRDLKKEQRVFYKSIVSKFCPILNDTVYFTSEGFNHLLYETHGRPRRINEQFMKLRCLKYAPYVVSNCKLITETREVELKIKGKKKKAFYYALVYEVSKSLKIRVIVGKIGTGKHKFVSVMPHDKKRHKKRKYINKKRHR